jgi:hypothetical protein
LKTAVRILLLLLFCGACAAQSTDPNSAKVEAGAKSWLTLVDAGQYGKAWTQASTEFQTRLREADWEKGASAKLGSTGGVKSRTLKSETPSDNIAGAPPGHYYTLQYYTEFKAADPANEFVTMLQDKDGSWKVVGYGLQNANATPDKP